jgi:hypothetical protein
MRYRNGIDLDVINDQVLSNSNKTSLSYFFNLRKNILLAGYGLTVTADDDLKTLTYTNLGNQT